MRPERGNMMAEHTPGPWRQVEYDDWLYIGGSEMDFIEYDPVDEPYNYHVENAACVVDLAAMRVENLTEEGIANARLIAAAPDLLAALEELLRVVYEGDWYWEVQPALKQAKSAVAKVEGE